MSSERLYLCTPEKQKAVGLTLLLMGMLIYCECFSSTTLTKLHHGNPPRLHCLTHTHWFWSFLNMHTYRIFRSLHLAFVSHTPSFRHRCPHKYVPGHTTGNRLIVRPRWKIFCVEKEHLRRAKNHLVVSIVGIIVQCVWVSFRNSLRYKCRFHNGQPRTHTRVSTRQQKIWNTSR